MKKMYNQPNVEISEVTPTSIVCASATFGGSTSEMGGGGSGDPITND